MADAVLAEDRTLLTALLEERALARMEKEDEERRRIDELNANPDSAENQVRRWADGINFIACVADLKAIIEKKIQEENLSQNYQDAMEYIPEAFGSVVMLYIPVVVNGIPCQAFVGTSLIDGIDLMQLLIIRLWGSNDNYVCRFRKKMQVCTLVFCVLLLIL